MPSIFNNLNYECDNNKVNEKVINKNKMLIFYDYVLMKRRRRDAATKNEIENEKRRNNKFIISKEVRRYVTYTSIFIFIYYVLLCIF